MGRFINKLFLTFHKHNWIQKGRRYDNVKFQEYIVLECSICSKESKVYGN
jgi:hypothetical protein